MIQLDRFLREQQLHSRMILTVHDELVFEIPPAEQEELVAVVPDLMAKVYALKVPLQVDLKIGPNWQDMERVRVVAATA